MRRLNEKRNYLHKLEREKISCNFQLLRKISRSRNREIRWSVAQVAALYPSPESESILLELLEDRVPMVRVNACDSLAFSQSDTTFFRLCKMCRDKNYLVRGYAVLSLGDVAINVGETSTQNVAIALLEEMLTKEKTRWVIVAAEYTLVRLNKECHFTNFIVNLQDRDYRIQSAVLNSLLELIACTVKFDHKKAKEELKCFLEKSTIHWLQEKAQEAYRLIELQENPSLNNKILG